MALTLALVLGIMATTGCGDDRSPSSSSRDEYERLQGGDVARAKSLHGAGKVDEARAILRKLAAHPEWEVRANAVSTIGDLKEKSLLRELHRALKDEQLFVRERASRVLQWMGDASSLPPLKEALTDAGAAVRGNAAEALARIDGAKQLDALVPLLAKDPDEGVRATTAAALGAARAGAAVDALLAALSDPSISVRARAIEALGEIGDPRARVALQRVAAKDPDQAVRRTAAAALKKLRG
jgi:HEAT repeat protein